MNYKLTALGKFSCILSQQPQGVAFLLFPLWLLAVEAFDIILLVDAIINEIFSIMRQLVF